VVSDVIAIQSASLETDQTHSGATLIVSVPVPPLGLRAGGLVGTEIAHLLPLGPSTPLEED
jgi:hypothetical protein